MNAYEEKAGMVYWQIKLCDPCLSALRYTYIVYKMALYRYSSFPYLSFGLSVVLCLCVGVFGLCACSSSQRQSGGGGEVGVCHRSDVKKQSSCKFDSTGMFHWCPSQSMSACVVVSSRHSTCMMHPSL